MTRAARCAKKLGLCRVAIECKHTQSLLLFHRWQFRAVQDADVELVAAAVERHGRKERAVVGTDRATSAAAVPATHTLARTTS